MIADKLSSLQLELLKIYSFQPSDEDLQAVKKLLAAYFSNKLVDKVAETVERKNISQDDLDRWLNE
ncbi:hypothetical protein [Spirosoma areae]